ncbi:MAG TPA: hypothetical protein VFU34_08665, partial [Gaiellaceae bacterium]|nr:hypothetical protein [Gaiellaceae bacterium]
MKSNDASYVREQYSARPARTIDAGFARVDADIGELRAEIGGLRVALLRVGGGIVIGLVGVIAAVLVSPIGG